MELWIRSQDRTTLIKCSEIYIADITSNYLIREVGSSHTLGAYKTIDRALEVLDEIQNILMPKMFLKSNGGAFVSNDNDLHIINPTYEKVEPLGAYVYEMPEE